MKINGSLVFDASGQSQIENLRVQKIEGSSVPAYTSADAGRLIYVSASGGAFTSGTLYYGSAVATNWVAIATGGNAAALQTEVDAIETSLGAGIAGDGTFVATGFSGKFGEVMGGAPTSFTDAVNKLAEYADGNNTLAELDDVTLSSLADGQYLKYSTGSQMWVNDTLQVADITDLTASAAELNILDGATLSTAELNILDGVVGTTAGDLSSIAGYAAQNVSATEFGYLDGVTGPIQTQLNNKQPIDDTLSAVAGLTGPGLVSIGGNGTEAWARTLVAPAEGITIANADGTGGNPTFALANDLAAIEGLSTTGIVVRTGDGTATTRAITESAGRIVVTNGDGVASAPTIDLATVTPTTGGTFQKFTSDSYGRVSAVEAVAAADLTTLVDGIYVNVTGDTMAGNLTFPTGYHISIADAPASDTHVANKAYVDSIAAGLTWEAPVLGIVADAAALPGGAAVGARYAVESPASIQTWNGTAWTVETLVDGAAFFNSANDTGYVYNGAAIVPFTGANAYTWGVGLVVSGNTVNINLGAGITELPSDEVGLDVAPNLALQLSSTAANGQLTFVLATGSGMEQSGAGLKISAGGVTNDMLQNSIVTGDADVGSGTLALGGTLNIEGSSVQGLDTAVASTGGVMTFTLTPKDASASQKGVASFNSGEFLVTSGAVALATGGVANDKLTNSSISFGSGSGTASVSLGGTLTVGGSGAISTSATGSTVTVAVAVATDSVLGVASFSSDHFSVAAGAVSLNASLDDLNNVAGADGAAAGSVLVSDGAGWTATGAANFAGTINLGDLKDVATATPTDGHVLVGDGTNWGNQKVYHLHTQSSASTTWTVSHNLGQKYCNVTVVDGSDEVVIPQSITFTDANSLAVTFNTSITGYVVVMGIA